MTTPTHQAPQEPNLNDWFTALPKGRQAILREDKWMLAHAAFEAGRQATGSTIEILPPFPVGWRFRVSGLHCAISTNLRAAIDAARNSAPVAGNGETT
jgi:hypothetical protein